MVSERGTFHITSYFRLNDHDFISQVTEQHIFSNPELTKRPMHFVTEILELSVYSILDSSPQVPNPKNTHTGLLPLVRAQLPPDQVGRLFFK